MRYPRPGEPIVPRLLRPLVFDRRPTPRAGVDTEMLARLDLGAGAWARLPSETLRRLSMLVVDRVQTRLESLPPIIQATLLPDPRMALTLPLEPRTLNTIRRGLVEAQGPWTVGRYIGLPRFGGRALIDLLAAVEARAGTLAVEQGPVAAAPPPPGPGSLAAVDAALAFVARRLPLSEARASAVLVRAGLVDRPVGVGELLRTAVRLGRDAPFLAIDLGGSRMFVRHADVTAARATYRIAVRAVQRWGVETIRSVATQLRVAVDALVAPRFVIRTLEGIAAFSWLDRHDGWFWFAQRSNPLVNNLRKIFSVATRLSLPRLVSALFRTRVGPGPFSQALQRICSAVPGTRIDRGEVSVSQLLNRGDHLGSIEARLADVLGASAGGLTQPELRGAVRTVGLSWPSVWRLLRVSPLVELAPGGRYQLIGAAA